MTQTLISLLSIVFGILGALVFNAFCQNKKTSLTALVILGVFSSILFSKSLGKLGVSPNFIVQSFEVNYKLLCLNLSISFLSGCFGTQIFSWLKARFGN